MAITPDPTAFQIRRSIEMRSAMLVSQPIVRMSDQSIYAREMLLRLKCADGQVVMPTTYLPLVEELGMEMDLDILTLEVMRLSVLPTLPKEPNQRFTLNVTPAALLQRDYLRHFSTQPWRTWLPWVTFELHDHDLLSSPEGQKLVAELAARGVSFAIAAYDGDVFKLARSLGIQFAKMGFGFFSSDKKKLLQMARLVEKSGLQLILTAIETQEQHDWARMAGAPFVQGYFYAKPTASFTTALALRGKF